MFYDSDNNAVFDSLKSFLLGGPHWTWIQGHEQRRDGRAAWLALKEHFDGPSSQIRLKASAYASIHRAEYKGAKNFDFELYRRIHTQAHLDLARYREPVPETNKVKDFLDGITEPALQPVKYTLAGFTHLMDNFEEAANYISNIIDLNKKGEFSSRNVSSTTTGRGSGRNGGRGSRRGGRGKVRNNGRGGRGRGRGRGGRTGGQNTNANNPGQWISSDEWNNMSEEDKESIWNARSNYAKCNISAVSGNNDSQEAEEEADASPPSPPKRAHASPSEAGDFMSQGIRNYISQIRTGARYMTEGCSISSSRQLNVTNPRTAKAELDSHADTTVAGSTCRVLEYTEKSCCVHPFSDEYEPMKQVPIAKVATAYDDPRTGETYILIFGQALYMGQTLDHTLICPNQACANGVIVDDIPRHLYHDRKSTHSIFFPEEDVRIYCY
jgi:hypothetical protein